MQVETSQEAVEREALECIHVLCAPRIAATLRALLSERDAATARAEAAEAVTDQAVGRLEDLLAEGATLTAQRDAAIAEREACAAQLDTMRKAHNNALIGQPHTPDTSIAYGNGADAIRARGPTPALDAALAQARREVWEKAREVARNVHPSAASATGEAHMRSYRDAIVHAISAAAGEEGK